jgi:hypothetical protein
MSNKNLVNQVIPANIMADAETKINEAYTLLKPFLVEALTSAEISGMAKLGEKSEPFVANGLNYAQKHPNTVPKRCNITEAADDFEVFNSLKNIDILVNQMAIRLSHTRILAGSEAIDCINDYYKNVQQDAKDGVAEAMPIYNDLKTRYENLGKKKIKTNNAS